VNLETTVAAISILARGEDLAIAMLVDTSGSSPRHSGAAMVVTADGSIVGTIGGGPLEATAIKLAVEVLSTKQSRVYRFDSVELGMLCGGHGLALIEYVDSARPEAAYFFRSLLGLLQSGRRGWLIMTLPPIEQATSPLRKCLVDADGSVSGDPLCTADSLQALTKRGGTDDRIIAEAPENTYVQAIGERGTAYVFGAGHCGAKLVPVLGGIGFRTVIIDDRAEFANADRFSGADRIVVAESFSGAVDALPIDEQSYVVIVTRGHAHDRDVLAQALGTAACYIGMIGSKGKVAKTFEMLREQGFSADDLARVHAPIGLSIGAETPEEIAISIAAELIQVRAGLEG
jgi:xanthine dehydrogenase accessory factor